MRLTPRVVYRKVGRPQDGRGDVSQWTTHKRRQKKGLSSAETWSQVSRLTSAEFS